MNEDMLSRLSEALLPAPPGTAPDGAGLLEKARRRRFTRRIAGAATVTACLVCASLLALTQARRQQRAEADHQIVELQREISCLAREMNELREEMDALHAVAEVRASARPAPRPTAIRSAANRLTVPYSQDGYSDRGPAIWSAPEETAAILREVIRQRQARGLDNTGRHEEIAACFPDTGLAERPEELRTTPHRPATRGG